ncbi:MAG: hypothetical protein M3433_04820 [Actinomycetota bacterium]|nr:hypothetical protein [Actinomycetota bacterium]
MSENLATILTDTRERHPDQIALKLDDNEVSYEHPSVLEAAVIGVEDEDMGEEVGAAVVLKEGEDVSEDDLAGYVKGEVATYRHLRKVWFVDELPRGPTGKILKREIEVPSEVTARP